MAVKIVNWNPRSRVFARRLRYGPRVDNFGDLLGPLIADKLLQNEGLSDRSQRDYRLLTVGSILHLAEDGDSVWGSGVNGKLPSDLHKWRTLDVRSVRGPLTAQFLRSRGVSVPNVFGDPGLLVGHLWDRAALARSSESSSYVVVPNFHDYQATYEAHPGRTVNPGAPMWDVIGRIAASDLVVGSSLHGIVVAESLGIPARLVEAGSESPFKYQDYFEGTGRRDVAASPDVHTALQWGGATAPEWDPRALIESFPRDLYLPSPSATSRNTQL